MVGAGIATNWPHCLPFQWQAAGVVFMVRKTFFFFFLTFPLASFP
jgi:hypothetical protein